MMKIMLLLLTLIGVVAGIPLGDYNVTFPCGKPVNNQRCRFPGEYCDITQGSCLSCNEDICREQDSDPSCRAFCYGRATKAPIARDSSEKKSSRDYLITMAVFVVLFVLVTIPACAVSIVLYRKSRKTTNEIIRPDPDAVELDAEEHVQRYTDGKNIMACPAS